MQERVTTSFIPKTSLQDERVRPLQRPTGSVLTFLLGVILVLVTLAALSLFAFEKYTAQSIENKKESLGRSRSEFEPNTLTELIALDSRIKTGESLLKKHPALSYMFDELEKRTLTTVRFNSFSYAANDFEGPILTLSGSAVSFNSVALQSDAFSESTLLKNAIFSDVNVGQRGIINFNFKAGIDTEGLRYQPFESTDVP